MRISEIQELLRFAEQITRFSGSGTKLKRLLGSKSKTAAFLNATKDLASDEEIAKRIYEEDSVNNKYLFLKSHATATLTDLFFDRSIVKAIESPVTKGIYETQKYYTLTTLVEKVS